MLRPAILVGPLFGLTVGIIAGAPFLIGQHAPNDPGKPASAMLLPVPPAAVPVVATPPKPQPPQFVDRDDLFAGFQRRIEQEGLDLSPIVGTTIPKPFAKAAGMAPQRHYRRWIRGDNTAVRAASEATQLNRIWLGGLLHEGSTR